MTVLKTLSFFDETGDIIVARFPENSEDTMLVGTQLIVQESQVACFFRDGQALDIFQAGRHTLNTQNLPLLSEVMGAAFGKRQPFQAYVYFIAIKTFINLGWGTATPVVFRDSDFRMITLRAFGSYAIRITRPTVFLNNMVGTKGISTTFALQDYLRTIIVARLNQVLGERMQSILDLPALYLIIAEDVKNNVAADFLQYGIELVDLLVEAITPPAEIQERIIQAGGYAIQDIEKYQAIAQADALRDAVKNPGTMGDTMNAGIGLAMGINMANMMAGQFAPLTANKTSTVSNIVPERLSAEEFRDKMRALKDLKDEGLLTEEEFKTQKERLLAQL